MEKEVLVLIRGALIGLAASLLIELVKHKLEQYRAIHFDAQVTKKKQSEKIYEFLRGETRLGPDGGAPQPAWLRQVSTSRRSRTVRLRARREEDLATAVYPVRPRPGGPFALLQAIRRQGKKIPTVRPRGQKFLLGPAHLIGRSSKCDIQILDPAISLLHALIRYETDHYMLYDLGSTSGTRVNGKFTGDQGIELLGGEKIEMGETVFEFGCARSEEP